MVTKDTFTATVPRSFLEDFEFEKWLLKIDKTELLKVEACKMKIHGQGLVTNAKALGMGLYERKWKDGLRLYFAVVVTKDLPITLFVLGSRKDKEQVRAIEKARKILSQYRVKTSDIKFRS